MQRKIKSDKIRIFFGDQDFNQNIKLIVILARWTIYNSRLRGSTPKAEYTTATVRSYLSTLRYTSILGNGENGDFYVNHPTGMSNMYAGHLLVTNLYTDSNYMNMK